MDIIDNASFPPSYNSVCDLTRRDLEIRGMISQKGNDLINNFGIKQFDYTILFATGQDSDSKRLESDIARKALVDYIAGLETQIPDLPSDCNFYNPTIGRDR